MPLISYDIFGFFEKEVLRKDELVSFFLAGESEARILVLRDYGVTEFAKLAGSMLKEVGIEPRVEFVDTYVVPYAFDQACRPLRPGARVEALNNAPCGSLGFGSTKEDRLGYVTALHVTTPNVFLPIYGNQQYQPTVGHDKPVGHLEQWSTIQPRTSGALNEADAAFVQLEAGLSLMNVLIHDDSRVVGTADATQGEFYEYSGYVSMHGKCRVMGTRGSHNVEYPNGLASFKDLIVTTHSAKPGDSGAILYKKTDYDEVRVVGILLGGQGSYDYWVSIGNIDRLLGTSPMVT